MPPDNWDTNERQGRASKASRMAMVGHIVHYPSGPLKNLGLDHRTVVVAISETEIFLVSICTYNERENEDPTCVVGPEDVPGAGLRHSSYLFYEKIYPTPHLSYRDVQQGEGGGFICKTPPEALARILHGLDTSEWLTDKRREKLFGAPKQQPEFEPGYVGGVRVEVRSRRQFTDTRRPNPKN